MAKFDVGDRVWVNVSPTSGRHGISRDFPFKDTLTRVTANYYEGESGFCYKEDMLSLVGPELDPKTIRVGDKIRVTENLSNGDSVTYTGSVTETDRFSVWTSDWYFGLDTYGSKFEILERAGKTFEVGDEITTDETASLPEHSVVLDESTGQTFLANGVDLAEDFTGVQIPKNGTFKIIHIGGKGNA